MTLEAGKEMDKRCVLDWLNEVYVTPSRAFDEYTEDELKMFAHDALVLLEEQEQPVRCKDCKYNSGKCNGLYLQFVTCYKTGSPHREDWYCADGERR